MTNMVAREPSTTNATKLRRKMNTKDDIELFWKWFQAFEIELSTSYHGSNTMKDIDLRVHQICPDLAWEIGPLIMMDSIFIVARSKR